jgi:hypothetical protein
MNAIFVDRVAGCRVDSCYHYTQAFQNLMNLIVRGWTVTNRGTSKEILKEKRVFAKTLDRLVNLSVFQIVSNQGEETTHLDHQVIH